MTDTTSKVPSQNIAWWIISLAISVICCAILFVVFASYLMGIKDNLYALKLRMDMAEQQDNHMSNDIDYIRHHMAPQQIQIMPAQGAPAVTPEAAVGAAHSVAPTLQPSPMPNKQP